jgi:hypothetical protein
VRKFQNEYKTIIELPHSIENAISKMESKQKDTSTTDENHDVPVEVELSTYA